MNQEEAREAYLARKEEEKEEKKDRWRLITGMTDFAAVVAGVIVCLLLVLLITSLVSFLIQDGKNTFSVILSFFK